MNKSHEVEKRGLGTVGIARVIVLTASRRRKPLIAISSWSVISIAEKCLLKLEGTVGGDGDRLTRVDFRKH